MVDSPVALGTMTRGELDDLVGWASAEGWLPGTHDAEVFHDADPEGFLVARVDGRMIAGISVVRSGPGFAFLGLFICEPEWRGRGIGRRLIEYGIAFGGDRVIGLDGVPAQVDFYGRLGFEAVHDSVRHEFDAAALAGAGDPTELAARGIRLEPGTPELRGAAVEYDAEFFPGDRRAFMSGWLAYPRRWWVALDPADSVVGLAVRRSAPPGERVGPLHADSADIAAGLLAQAAQGVSGPVFLDVPMANADAAGMAAALGGRPMFACTRMYRGGVPSVPIDRAYGVGTFELG